MLFISATFLLVSASAILLGLCPFTKVEESFNLHAIHDWVHQPTWSAIAHQGDHVQFTGPVPRTFIGAFFVGFITSLIARLGRLLGLVHSKFSEQIIARAVLGIANITSIIYFGLCARITFGTLNSIMMLLICCCQFHLTFYSTRTLPNMFAFPLVQIALGQFLYSLNSRRPSTLIRKNQQALRSFTLLTFTSIVFRIELILLLAPISLVGLILKKFSLWSLVGRGFLASFGALELTVPIDSYFWQKLTWPEGASVVFNVYQGQSKQWGVMPWHYYFTTSLTKSLGIHYILGGLGFFLNRRIFILGVISFIFITGMSFLGHKETRFIIYVFPMWNLSSAILLRQMSNLLPRWKWLKRSFFTAVFGITILHTVLITYLSMNNYVGGEAMMRLHSIDPLKPHALKIHLDDLVCQSGASRFLQLKDSDSVQVYPQFQPVWTYDKLHLNLTLGGAELDVILSERPANEISKGFKLLDTIPTFKRLKIERAKIDYLRRDVSHKIREQWNNAPKTPFVSFKRFRTIAEVLSNKAWDLVEFDDDRVKIYVNERLGHVFSSR